VSSTCVGRDAELVGARDERRDGPAGVHEEALAALPADQERVREEVRKQGALDDHGG
jgi:hypothetical protein